MKRVLPLLSLAILLAGCTPIVISPESNDAQSDGAQSPGKSPSISTQPTQEPQSTSTPSPSNAEASTSIPGLPFDVTGQKENFTDVTVLDVKDAAPFAGMEVGQTKPVDNMPGPFVSSILQDGQAFGSLTTRNTKAGDGLESYLTVPGIIAQDGAFTPLTEVENTSPIKELKGSNPDKLYFEAQNSSASGNWVLWREGSAGKPGAMRTLESDDWRIVGWNRSTGTVQEFASAFLLHGDRFAPSATWDVAPTTDGKSIFFEAMVPNGDSWKNEIIAIPLDSPGTVKEIADGTMPVANNKGVGFLKGNQVLYAGNEIFGIKGDGWQLTRLAISDRLLVATAVNEERAWLLIWNLDDSKMIAAIDTGSDWAEASAYGSKIVWGNSSWSGNPSMYFWDSSETQKSPELLGELQGLSVPRIGPGLIAVPGEDQDGAIIWKLFQIE
jgi:hypothetical protein